jgi:hypothetical protein
MRDQLRNWAAVVPALLDRAHREATGAVLDREATGAVLDRETAELVRDLRGRPDVAKLLTEPDLSPGTAPIVDLHFEVAGTSLRFYSAVSTIGAPIDVTAQELRVEAFSLLTTRAGTAGRVRRPPGRATPAFLRGDPQRMVHK